MTAEGVRCQGTAGRGLRTLSTLSDDPRSSSEKKTDRIFRCRSGRPANDPKPYTA